MNRGETSFSEKGAAHFGEVVIDFDRMELRRAGHLLPATGLEFRLLWFFVNHPRRVFSREDLIRAVWPLRERATRRTVDNYISHLRHKLERNPASPVYLQTVYGAGYKFVLPEETLTAEHAAAQTKHAPQ